MLVDEINGIELCQFPQGIATFASDAVFSNGNTIDPPSPALLALHLALCKVFHASGMAEIEMDIARESEDFTSCKSDGSTSVEEMIRSRMQRWLCSDLSFSASPRQTELEKDGNEEVDMEA